MIAGIIAAGEGSRLQSEGITVHKPLVRLDGVPLIERLIRSFGRCGITRAVCIVNEYSLDVKEFVEHNNFGIPVNVIVQTTPSSMHSLFALAPQLMEDRFLLSTVDAVFDEQEFSQFVSHSQERTASDGILAVTNFIDDENPLYVKLGAAMRIVSFSKSESTPWVTGGLYVLSPGVFNERERVLQQGIERLRNFLSYLIARGYVLEGFPFSKIVDVDHAEDIRTAELFLRGE